LLAFLDQGTASPPFDRLEGKPDQARHDLLEILEDWYGRKSTIVTSQPPTASCHHAIMPSCHHAISDSTYADAIPDRLLHNAHPVELESDSLRRTVASIRN
jgi:hypothetical protein